MRKFTSRLVGEVDLDNPSTYSYLPDNVDFLDRLMFREIGYALVYMDYFPDRKGFFPKRKKKDEYAKMSEMFCDEKYGDNVVEINNSSYNQRQRIYELIKDFAKNRKHNYQNIMWYKEQIFLFQEETENMC